MAIMTDNDHINLSEYLGHVLDDFRDGTITKLQAVSSLAHVMTALDEGETEEVKSCLQQGRKFIRRDVS